MPFVQRDSSGNIISSHATKQPGVAEEELSNDSSELIAFYAKFPANFHTPPTESEWQKIHQQQMHLAREHEAIRNNVSLFNAVFSELELALGALLYVIINIPRSRLAYAIYFSPTGFEARLGIVDNSLKQIAFENDELKDLLPLWDRVFRKVNKAREIRNTISHSSPQNLIINGRSYARLTAPAFDVIRLGRKIAERQIPGLTASDVKEAVQTARFAQDRVDEVNRLLTAFHGDRPTMAKRFRELEAGLQTSRSQEQVVQIVRATRYQSPPAGDS
jgi:hypothetical protein